MRVAYPSCASLSTYYIERRFGLEPHTIEQLELIFDTASTKGQVGLDKIRQHLEETDGLHTSALSMPLSRLDKYFESAVAIVHSKSWSLFDKQEAPHYFVLEKHSDRYILIDPPERVADVTAEPGDRVLDQTADEHNLTGYTLVVSDKPIELPDMPTGSTPLFATAVMAVVVCFALLWWRLRRHAR